MSRDYMVLSEPEKKEWKKLQQEEIVDSLGTLEIRKSLFSKYPKGVRHFISMFPNHYLDTIELQDTESLDKKNNEFSNLLNKSSLSERAILNFINQNSYFFIIGSLLKKYFNFGHHEACVFREFPLGTSHKADYLLIGRNSDGWHFVFVELETPCGRITLADGALGEAFRKGKSQVDDWNHWLEKNFNSLQEYFSKHTKRDKQLPEEFCNLDKSRINYVVIAGRRSNFLDKTYRIQREAIRNEQVHLIHYDNVVDAINELRESSTY